MTDPTDAPDRIFLEPEPFEYGDDDRTWAADPNSADRMAVGTDHIKWLKNASNSVVRAWIDHPLDDMPEPPECPFTGRKAGE